MAESVLGFIVRPSNNVMATDVPNNRKGASQKYQFHQGVVKGDKISKNVQVTASKNDGVKFLRLQRNTCASPEELKTETSEKAISGEKKEKCLPAQDLMVWILRSKTRTLAREPWIWHGENHGTQKNYSFDASRGACAQVTLNEEDLSYMFDEATPVKECGDLWHYVIRPSISDNMSKEPEEKREASSQAKRRRMLQFDRHVMDSSLVYEEMPSAFLKSRDRDGSTEEVLPDSSQWIAGFSEDASASSYEGLDQSCEGWLAEYFNDADMLLCSDDMNPSGTSDVQLDISELCNAQPESRVDAVQKQAIRTPRNVIFKGRNSFIHAAPKIASSVAYPFAFIKPCDFHGDVTLKDINQRIRTPPPSKSEQSNDDLAAAFPTSAFSGKPVVGKIKIRTEGGKGSITIMRTKG